MRHQQFSSTYHFVQTSIHIAVGAIKLLQTQLGADHSALLSKPLSNAGLLTWTVGGAPCWMRRTSSAQQSRKTVILSHVKSPCTALHYMCSVKHGACDFYSIPPAISACVAWCYRGICGQRE